MSYYPVYLEVKNRLCIVIGGGIVGERKVLTLLDCGARVRVISPALTARLEELVDKGAILCKKGEYQPGDLEGAFLVISAAGSKAVNSAVAIDCYQRGILVNVVDEPEQGNFFVPSSVRRGPLSIAISTGGKSPLMARLIREELEQIYNEDFASFIDFLGDVRKKIISEVHNPAARKKLLSSLVDRETLRLLRQGCLMQAKERVNNVFINYRS